MKRIALIALLGFLACSQTGCTSCKRLFGLDHRCEPPPPQYYQGTPVVSGPVSYGPAPSNCNTPK